MVGSFWPDLLRIFGLLVILYLLYRAQRYWFARAWRLTHRVRKPVWRGALRAFWLLAVFAVTWPLLEWIIGFPRVRFPLAVVGLWLVAAMFSWLGVLGVKGIERCWNWMQRRRMLRRKARSTGHAQDEATGNASAQHEVLPNPSRRFLFQSTAVAVGIAPFAVSLYGYFGERLRYVVERVEVPMPNLPEALDGMRIVQLSDIHLSAYLSREEARRAVEMANDLGADMAVVTGDFITGRTDHLPDCVEELAALRAPMGVWGCNGNHEIYAECEAAAARLFGQAGMRLLRQENAQATFRGQPLNIIGVDYQRTRAMDGPRPMLDGVEHLVRRGVFNILLSHNPNAFPRAVEIGIPLTLAGHTHGGQVQVEILDYRLSPARFMTEFIEGLYQRPGGALYVNRGIGTVGTPIRVGSPPEITLLTLRRA